MKLHFNFWRRRRKGLLRPFLWRNPIVKARVYCDGSYRFEKDPKHGTVCVGIYMTIQNPKRRDYYFSRFLGYGNNSNTAEELAIQHACNVLDTMNIEEAIIYSDSLSSVDKLSKLIKYELKHVSRSDVNLKKAHYLAKSETKKIYGTKWKTYSIPESF